MTETFNAVTVTPVLDDDGGTVVSVTVANAVLTKGDMLAGLQAAVGGGYVECIDVFHRETGSRLVIWINGDGKHEGMPRNVFAEAIAADGGWAGREWADWIAGPVICTGLDYETGETVGIPDEWLIRIVALGMGQ